MGTYLQVFAWLLLTAPYRLYYSVLGVPPRAQDLWNLFTTPLSLALETIDTLLSVSGVSPALLSALFSLAAVVCFGREREREREREEKHALCPARLC
jgi:hypothetical protein